MQGNCLWAEYTEQTAFAGILATKLLGSAFIPDSCSIIDRLCSEHMLDLHSQNAQVESYN